MKWKVLVAQLCLTFWDPMDCSPPGSSVHGIFSRQEYWSGLPFPSPGYLPRSRDQTQVSCIAGRLFTTWASREASITLLVAQVIMNLPAMQETQETRFWDAVLRRGFDPWVGKILWKRKWQPTPVFSPRKSHGQSIPVDYSPWGCKTQHDLATTVSLCSLFVSKAWHDFRTAY